MCEWTYKATRIIPKDELPFIPRHLCVSKGKSTITNVDAPSLAWSGQRFSQGSRNQGLAKWVGWLIARSSKEANDGRIEAFAQGLNQVVCDPPLDASEVGLMVRSLTDKEYRKRAEREAVKLGLDKL